MKWVLIVSFGCGREKKGATPVFPEKKETVALAGRSGSQTSSHEGDRYIPWRMLTGHITKRGSETRKIEKD